MGKDDVGSFCPSNQQDWRRWLEKNYAKKDSVWLILYKKTSGVPTITWSEAVDEALCFGWIDSVKKTIDQKKYMQYFGKRKAKSMWSAINKAKVEQLIKEGRMTKAGLASIEIAKQNGSWSIVDTVERLEIPEDLDREFKKKPGSKDYFLGLSKSAKKSLLAWVVLAKTEETRFKRITDIAENAHKGLKPKQFR